MSLRAHLALLDISAYRSPVEKAVLKTMDKMIESDTTQP
jgi:hypothetical protein